MMLYHQSGMFDYLRDTLVVDGEQYYIYADAAYVLRAWLEIAFQEKTLQKSKPRTTPLRARFECPLNGHSKT